MNNLINYLNNTPTFYKIVAALNLVLFALAAGRL
jgi:hypothetical protein